MPTKRITKLVTNEIRAKIYIRDERQRLAGEEDVLVPTSKVSSLLLLSILALVPVPSHLIAATVACMEVSVVRSRDRRGNTIS